MRITTIFFDLDDTLYPNRSGLWPAIQARMNEYMRTHLQVPPDEIPKLREKYFLQYGTTLRGLQKHHEVDTLDFLAYVHDLPLRNYLAPDSSQRAVIASLDTRNLIFTNADAAHAGRVLAALELDGLFAAVVDLHAVAPYCKPMPESFDIALKLAGEDDAARCVMIDDLPRTTSAARARGMRSILYGRALADSEADGSFTDWTQLPSLLASLQ